MRQQGFALIAIIGVIAVIIAVGIGGYVLISKQDTVSETSQEQERPETVEEEVGELPQIAEEPGGAEKIEKKSVPELAGEPVETKTPVFTQSQCSRTFSPQYGSGPYYTGFLFDAHFHMPNVIDYSSIEASSIEGHGGSELLQHGGGSVAERDAEIDRILCVFGKEKVRGIIGFVMGDQSILSQTVEGAKSVRQAGAGNLNLFLSPIGFSAASLENIEASNKGLFDGYGETSFGFGGMPDQNPDDQKFLDVYKVAGKNNLIVMIHPGARQESRIENILQKNPDVTFLFHGPESENSIHGIIGKYPNAYYSIDAMLIRLPSSPGALMYTVSGKNEFKTKFVQNYSIMLNNTLDQWKSKIEQYPDRYMWGTDRSDPWTYDEDISAMIEEFARDFIGELGSSVQEKFAYRNAERLLQER